jgi:hypothetical protein
MSVRPRTPILALEFVDFARIASSLRTVASDGLGSAPREERTGAIDFDIACGREVGVTVGQQVHGDAPTLITGLGELMVRRVRRLARGS